MRRASLVLALLVLASLAAPMRHEFRMRWGWGDLMVVGVAAMVLTFGALLVNFALLGAALLALAVTAAMMMADFPQWWRGVLAFALLMTAFALLFI
ncbi:MAG: hypothetical protein GXO07_05505 [Crenarchaeota archaeon]|nr:hypothetical protein [Thermoproteota archaeon]